MKKEDRLILTAGLGGAIGLALRRMELSLAYDPELKLMSAGPATWMLWGLAAVLLILFAAGCRGMGKKEWTPQQWIYAPHKDYIAIVVCAAFLLMAAGLVGLWEQSRLYRKEPLELLAWGLCLVGGVCVLMAGQSAYRGRWTGNTPLLHMGPSFAMLLWLVAGYQDHARQPETGLFVWQMLSGVAVVLALYGLVTLAVGKGGAGRTCVFCLMGTCLSYIAMADSNSIAFKLVYLFAIFYLTAQSAMLLRVCGLRTEAKAQGTDGDGQTAPEE